MYVVTTLNLHFIIILILYTHTYITTHTFDKGYIWGKSLRIREGRGYIFIFFIVFLSVIFNSFFTTSMENLYNKTNVKKNLLYKVKKNSESLGQLYENQFM